MTSQGLFAASFGPNQTVRHPPTAAKIHHGNASRLCSTLWPPSPSVLNSNTAREGVIVMALRAEMTVDTEIVTANCRKNNPVMPPMKAHGTNTAHSTRATAMIGPVTSSIAMMVAVRASWPRAIMRSMFSSTTMASSTTMPMASTSPNRVRLLSV